VDTDDPARSGTFADDEVTYRPALDWFAGIYVGLAGFFLVLGLPLLIGGLVSGEPVLIAFGGVVITGRVGSRDPCPPVAQASATQPNLPHDPEGQKSSGHLRR
jgi:hypothetical protein